jgi:hypothetical protein
MTDGEENSSREWTMQAINELIRSKEAAGNWTFVFQERTLTHSSKEPASALGWRTLSATIPRTTGASTPPLAQNTNRFAGGDERAEGDFFKDNATGIKKP